jgi:hypothetical protein
VLDPSLRLRVANAGWARPVKAVAITAHLVGAAGLLRANRGRAATQGGIGASTVAKLVLTGAALAVTVYNRALGKELQPGDGVPVAGATDPAPVTPPELAKAQQQLDTCQWLIPTLTGGISVLNALQGEHQRPTQQLLRFLATPGAGCAPPPEPVP